ncbi:TonB-dependent receptor domain-containing protein [Synoicihabitans lomoniglobus]|uniref:TonB-dependent receptor n=1 Tax=Synoicihabitans lomoniglobus TaxID=2909285 RepID=A0AAF0A1H3_9BACT|nr:TonB-dependent receptor [Opitutaceae bacterium LMO-M01]WED65017.1 TonB-dependent receptor [Opitutaceae bacterium LMO-M01]
MKLNLSARATLSRRSITAYAFGCALTVAPAALAQDSSESGEDTVTLGAYVVTGSHIPTTETAFDARTIPVEIMNRAKIEQAGYTTAGELLQRMTASNAGSVPIANNATGFTPAASSTSLRGLGPDATLVLINGSRVSPYPIGTGGTTAFVDLNSIPVSAIERVEVLKDGASATYGADAVAGVVNIILRRDFEGTEVSLGYGNTSNRDASETTVSVMTGVTGKDGWITAGFNFYNREAIFAADRDYSAVPPFLSSNSSPINIQITREAANEALGQNSDATIPGVPDGSDLFFTSSYSAREGNNGDLPASAYDYGSGRSSSYNFNESAGAYPNYERAGAFLSFEKKVFGSDNLRAYGDLIYQNTQAVNELAPSATGNFANPGGVSIVIPARTANPFLTPGETAAGGRSAAAGAYNPFNPFNQDISGASRARLAEFGNRIYREDTDSMLLTLGIKADSIGNDWTLDMGLRYSRIDTASNDSLVSISRLNRILDANDPIFDPSSSEYIGTTVPYNPFGYYRNPIASNDLVVSYASVNLHNQNESDMGLGYVRLGKGSLFEMPAGDVGFATGIEYRIESLTQSPDALGVSGDVIGSSTANITGADRSIGAIYAEAELPIARDAPGAHALSLTLAGRFEEFYTSHLNTFVPKVGVKWLPFNDEFVIRATYGEGFREPSLYELFASGLTYSLSPVTDPSTGLTEPEQDVTIASSPALAPEETKSTNIGFVWTPDVLKGFTFSMDLWKIERAGTVTVDHQDVINRDFAGETLLPGESVQRDAGGNVILVNGVFRNLGNTDIQGIDFATSYVLPTDAMGRFDFSFSASYLDSIKIQQFPGAPFFEYAGEADDILFDNATGDVSTPGLGDDAYVQWKAQVIVDWSLNAWSASVTGHFTDGYRDFTGNWDPSAPADPTTITAVDSRITWDTQLNYTAFAGSDRWYGDAKLTLGVRNVLDEDPPFVSGWGGNTNGYPGFLYNAEGRFYYLSLTKKL